LSHDEIGDAAGVVAAVDIDAVEETRLPNDSHEFVRESAMLELALVADVDADAAQHAAHDVDRDVFTCAGR
jgi:hypothetical protein